MSKFTKTGKQAAYEKALHIVANWSDAHLSRPRWVPGAELGATIQLLYPRQSYDDICHVATKAIKAERERRADCD